MVIYEQSHWNAAIVVMPSKIIEMPSCGLLMNFTELLKVNLKNYHSLQALLMSNPRPFN
jgi:hypothetical protein